MNIGLYQSASALSALERWQDSVSQNISSSQTAGYRKRTINFSALSAGELHTNKGSRVGDGDAINLTFPKVNHGVNFVIGETQPTRGELDVAIQGEGFFEIQRDDGTKAYTRAGEFRMRADRTLVTANGGQVLSDTGAPILLLAGGGPVTITRDGAMFQGENSLGRISVQKFANNEQLQPLAGGFFLPTGNAQPERVDKPELMQGYVEGSNVSSLREMVDLVLISRAYEANQKIIKTVDEQMQKTFDALG